MSDLSRQITRQCVHLEKKKSLTCSIGDRAFVIYGNGISVVPSFWSAVPQSTKRSAASQIKAAFLLISWRRLQRRGINTFISKSGALCLSGAAQSFRRARRFPLGGVFHWFVSLLRLDVVREAV